MDREKITEEPILIQENKVDEAAGREKLGESKELALKILYGNAEFQKILKEEGLVGLQEAIAEKGDSLNPAYGEAKARIIEEEGRDPEFGDKLFDEVKRVEKEDESRRFQVASSILDLIEKGAASRNSDLQLERVGSGYRITNKKDSIGLPPISTITDSELKMLREYRDQRGGISIPDRRQAMGYMIVGLSDHNLDELEEMVGLK